MIKKFETVADVLADPEQALRMLKQYYNVSFDCAGCWDIGPGDPYFVKEVTPEEYESFELNRKTEEGWEEDAFTAENGRIFVLVCTDEEAHNREMNRQHAVSEKYNEA